MKRSEISFGRGFIIVMRAEGNTEVSKTEWVTRIGIKPMTLSRLFHLLVV